jgi:hypothetical protein
MGDDAPLAMARSEELRDLTVTAFRPWTRRGSPCRSSPPPARAPIIRAFGVVIGHMGEMLPVMLARFDDVFTNETGYLKRSVSQTILDHVVITTSGFFSTAPFVAALMTFREDRARQRGSRAQVDPVVRSLACAGSGRR